MFNSFCELQGCPQRMRLQRRMYKCTQRKNVSNWNKRWARSALQLILYIYILWLSVCFLFVSKKKRQNGWTFRANIACGTSHDPREGLWMMKISKICLQQLWFQKNPRYLTRKAQTIMFFFCNIYKEKMFTIEIEYGCEAP